MIEVKMSSIPEPELVEAVGRLVMRFQDSSQKFDAEVGRLYGLNPAELHCLSFLSQAPRPANAIAREVRLTPAAVTALVDRLERRGYVRRRADPDDRRKVLVTPTAMTAALAAATYGLVAEAGAKVLSKYGDAELRVLVRLLSDVIAVQEDAIAGLANGTKAPAGDDGQPGGPPD